MALLRNVPPPIGDAIALPKRKEYKGDARDPQEGRISRSWIDYFTSLQATVDKAAANIKSVYLSDQDASVSATPFDATSSRAGLYRVSWYAQIVVEDGISSTMAVTIGWTNRGEAQTETGADMTGNTLQTHQSLSLPLIRVDSQASITYAVNWSSGLSAGVYDITLVLEEVPA